MSTNTRKSNKVVNEVLKQNLTPEMFEEVQETFNMTIDATGSMPASKLPLALKALGMSTQEIDSSVKIPNEIDIDKFIEIVYVCMRHPNWAANEMNETFAIFDKDGSGLIDPSELRRVFTRIGENLLDVELDDQLREVDIDGDLQMAVAEYYNMIANAKGTDFIFDDSLI
jgi:calmodulin